LFFRNPVCACKILKALQFSGGNIALVPSSDPLTPEKGLQHLIFKSDSDAMHCFQELGFTD